MDQLAVQDLRACLEVNVVGTWLACCAAAAPMRAAGYGRILTLASALGRRPVRVRQVSLLAADGIRAERV